MTAWLEGLDVWVLAGWVAVVALAVGVLVGRWSARATGTVAADAPVHAAPPQEPMTRPAPATGGGDPDLVAGLIAAHDLAAEARATVVQAHVERVLGNAGIRRIPAEPDRPFDAAVHLAVSVERNAAAAAPMVGREVRPGWSKGDAVVRPAEVVVLSP
jgi:hypothetical protein